MVEIMFGTAAISQVDILYLQRVFDQDVLNLIKDYCYLL